MNKSIADFLRTGQLAEGKTAIHRFNPGLKMLILIVYLVIVISIPQSDFSRLAPFILLPALISAAADVPLQDLLRGVIPALPLILAAALSNLFFLRTPLFNAGSFQVTDGMIAFLTILLKSLLTVTAMSLLMAVTQFDQILNVLGAIGTPDILLRLISLSYRYLIVFFEEAAAMQRAYQLRSGHGNISIRHAGSYIGQLLLRSFNRAERVAFAMKCRDGGMTVQSRRLKRASAREIAIALVVIGGNVFLRVVNVAEIFGNWVTA